MRLLFIKETLAWPRSSGHDVHSYYMMRALAARGHVVGLATLRQPGDDAVRGLTLERLECFADNRADDPQPDEPQLPRLQERFRSYWGIDKARIRNVARIAEALRADAVITVGLNVLPYLGAVRSAARVWYAADEWAWHHLSQVRLLHPSTWGNMRQALVKGLYERAYASLLDRVWVVSEGDRRAMRWVAGVRNLDVMPNGVDGDYYAPRDLPQQARTCTFWGRLDFGPNQQALEWFCGRVWPVVRRAVPDARFTVYGFSPTPSVQTLTGHDGIELVPNLPDLRDEVARQAAVVLPFVSGGGIKNKLLEAASMGKPIVCTPRACGGLHAGTAPPVLAATRPAQWADNLRRLWDDADLRHRLGGDARGWVLRWHTWEAAARTAEAGLEQTLHRKAVS
jgi:glycosyltransferase involved in cell wall biosynthesis